VTRSRAVAAILAVALGVAVVAAIGAGRSARSDVVSVLVIAPLSGPGAALGDSSRVGMELAIEDLRHDGADLKLVFQDSRTDARTALTLLASREHYATSRVVISEMSQVTRALVKPAEEQNLLLLATLVGVPNIGDGSRSFIRVNVMSDAIAPPVARFAAARTKRIAILYLNDDYGRVNQELFARTFVEAGGMVVLTESFGTDPAATRTLVEKVRASGVSDCFIAGYGAAYSELFRAFKELSPSTQLYADIGISNAPVFSGLGSAAEGVYFAGTEIDEYPPTTERARRFASRFDAKKPGHRPDYVVAYSYDSVRVLSDAMRAVPSGEPPQLREYLISRTFDGLGGPFRFDSATGDSLYAELPILQVRDGRIVGPNR
jgi:branched-chain amino acid transport system substrate-binding protein